MCGDTLLSQNTVLHVNLACPYFKRRCFFLLLLFFSFFFFFHPENMQHSLCSRIAGIQSKKTCKLNKCFVSKQRCLDCIEKCHIWSFFYIIYTFLFGYSAFGSTFKVPYIRNSLIMNRLIKKFLCIASFFYFSMKLYVVGMHGNCSVRHYPWQYILTVYVFMITK